MNELDVATLALEIPLAALAMYTVGKLASLAQSSIDALREIALDAVKDEDA